MNELWEDVKKRAVEASKIITEKTKEYSKIANIKLKLAPIKLEKKELLTELGNIFYKLYKKGSIKIDDEKIHNIIDKIEELEKTESKYKREIKKIKK